MNQSTDDSYGAIISVTLVGYDFTSLSVNKGDSQIFNLDRGMPAGYENINVEVSFPRIATGRIRFRSIVVNFNDGDTTTITMKGCISGTGCSDIYLE